MHAINLNELGMDKTQKFIDFIRESFGTQKGLHLKVGEKKIKQLGMFQNMVCWRKSVCTYAVWKNLKNGIFALKCTGDPKDNEECFELVN